MAFLDDTCGVDIRINGQPYAWRRWRLIPCKGDILQLYHSERREEHLCDVLEVVWKKSRDSTNDSHQEVILYCKWRDWA